MIRFVTGTDTGVGKTIVSAVLAREAAERGMRVRYVKPVQTGLAPDEPGSDADLVRAHAGIEAEELLRFPEPLAPAIAVSLAGERIDPDELAGAIRARASSCDLLLVEGAGGLLVPLCDGWTMADLARALEAPLIVVARPGLGTLNHTMLTLEAAERRGLTVSEVVLTPWPEHPGITERTNLDVLRQGVPSVRLLGPIAVPTAAPGSEGRSVRPTDRLRA